MTASRQQLARALPWITGAWVLLQLLSLRLNLLAPFFFDTAHADVQGIDFFSLPKAWLNLRAGRSLYGTFDPPAFGPHFTWYLAHPVLAVVLGGPLSQLQPVDSYGAFTLLSLGLLALCAFLLARESTDILIRRAIWLLLLGSFPGYLMLWVGNVQALTVLGLTLVFVGILRLRRFHADAPWYLRAGLLLALFTKPVVLLILPLLLLVKETRRAAFDALAAYLPVSLLFEVVPALNPERLSLNRVAFLGLHPSYVRQHLDIYSNGLQLSPDMRDNSIHWFNLVAGSGFRLQHIDVYSLPVFLDGILGQRVPDWIFALPTLFVLGVSVAVARMRDGTRRQQAALLLVLAGTLDFFLAYPTAWEYQYTAVLPVAGTLLLLGPHGSGLSRPGWVGCLALAACAWLPSLYFLHPVGSPSTATLLLSRLDRVLPVTALFAALLWTVGRQVYLEHAARSSVPVSAGPLHP